jgi:DNA-binding FadR family transcriptional regulator
MVVRSGGANHGLPTEVELSTSLEVSRNAVREAVKALAAKGMVEVGPRTGTKVRARHLWNHLDPDVLRWSREIDRVTQLRELSELREAAEPMAARLAAKRASAQAVTALWRHYIAMEDAVKTEDLASFVANDALFHHSVMEAAGNNLFGSLAHAIDTVLEDAFTQIANTVQDVAESVPLHLAVVRGITEGEQDSAEEAMRRVVRATSHRIGVADDPPPA